MQPKNRPERTTLIDGALGEGSSFHQQFGFYVHGVEIDAATLPHDWAHRMVPVFDPVETRNRTGWCLEAHDLAASKLFAFRDKDREFVQVLLAEGLISAPVLHRRVEDLDIDAEWKRRLLRWVELTMADLRGA